MKEGAHINDLELSAEILALESFFPFGRRRQVKIVTDSLVKLHIVRNCTSRSPNLLENMILLRNFCERHRITTYIRLLPSVLNCWMDRLSRRRDTPARRLSYEVRLLLQRLVAFFLLEGNNIQKIIPPADFLPLFAPRPSLIGVWAP